MGLFCTAFVNDLTVVIYCFPIKLTYTQNDSAFLSRQCKRTPSSLFHLLETSPPSLNTKLNALQIIFVQKFSAILILEREFRYLEGLHNGRRWWFDWIFDFQLKIAAINWNNKLKMSTKKAPKSGDGTPLYNACVDLTWDSACSLESGAWMMLPKAKVHA